MTMPWAKAVAAVPRRRAAVQSACRCSMVVPFTVVFRFLRRSLPRPVPEKRRENPKAGEKTEPGRAGDRPSGGWKEARNGATSAPGRPRGRPRRSGVRPLRQTADRDGGGLDGIAVRGGPEG